MASLNLPQLRTNPFRVLGLSASAGQADIFAAARRMRIFANPQEISSTQWDVPSLGALSRERTDIEHSVSQLSDPVTRLEHRQRWFAHVPPSLKKSWKLQGDPNELDPGVASHDRDLWQIAALLMSDPSMKRGDAWHDAFSAFFTSTSNPAYLSWMRQVEQEGRFDKVATASEMKFVADSVVMMVGEQLAEQARSALDHGARAEVRHHQEG